VLDCRSRERDYDVLAVHTLWGLRWMLDLSAKRLERRAWRRIIGLALDSAGDQYYLDIICDCCAQFLRLFRNRR
jgi:hypothetical protein